MTTWEETRNTIQDNPETYEELTGLKVARETEALAPVIEIAVLKGGVFYRTDRKEEEC